MIKKQFEEFLRFINLNRARKIKFFLLGFSFLLFPTQNHYLQLKIPSGRPVVRSVKINSPEISLYPVNLTQEPAPFLTALAALVIDIPSKTIIFAKNPDWQLLPASTTKIMTALVALDQWQLDDVLEVKRVYAIGQTMGLEAGEKITLKSLLYGLLVQSGNDAAYTLAENYPGGPYNFVKAMNKKGKELNLWQTNFVNPAGIDNYRHFTTAHDLAVLASEAVKNEVLAKIVATSVATVTDTSGEIKHELENINQLVGAIPGVKGIKTGWTENAGECLVAYIKKDQGEVITVVLGSEDRFGETKSLIDWVFANFNWNPIDTTLE